MDRWVAEATLGRGRGDLTSAVDAGTVDEALRRGLVQLCIDLTREVRGTETYRAGVGLWPGPALEPALEPESGLGP